jgi:hypothetical protein
MRPVGNSRKFLAPLLLVLFASHFSFSNGKEEVLKPKVLENKRTG